MTPLEQVQIYLLDAQLSIDRLYCRTLNSPELFYAAWIHAEMSDVLRRLDVVLARLRRSPDER